SRALPVRPTPHVDESLTPTQESLAPASVYLTNVATKECVMSTPSLRERIVCKIRISRTIPMLVLSVITLITLSIAPETCKASPILVAYVETPTSFTLTITGGGFAFNDTH